MTITEKYTLHLMPLHEPGEHVSDETCPCHPTTEDVAQVGGIPAYRAVHHDRDGDGWWRG